MISHNYKAIFVHINRTGGTSIEQALGRIVRVPEKHWTAAKIAENAPEAWQNYFKFTFIRNPWDRMVSMYHYRRLYPKHFKVDLSQEFDEWIDSVKHRKTAVFRSQKYWLTVNDKIAVDYIGRFSHLTQDFRKICKKLDLRPNLPHLNKTVRKDYRHYYDDNTAETVAKMHADDIKLFDFNFDDAEQMIIPQNYRSLE